MVDNVNHEKLIYKHHGYGIRGKILTWIKAFLNGRSQTVVLEGDCSEEMPESQQLQDGNMNGIRNLTRQMNRMQPLIEEKQNNPREYRDQRKPLYLAFLDVKSAFDVVSHGSLLRKLFHIGVEGATWTLIHSLHQDAESIIKWNGAYSEAFKVQQGVRQGGILSTDLYKLYGNNLLDRLKLPGIGVHIGEIPCVAPVCADDMVLASDRRDALQSLSIVNVAVDHSCLENYLLQPLKSVTRDSPEP